MLGCQKLSWVLKHSSVSFRGVLFHGNTAEQKLDAARNLCMSLRRYRKSESPRDDEEVEVAKPLKFSTSKASHRVWRVNQALGSREGRPWWKVLPVSLFGICFLVWCVYRKGSEIDKKLEKELDEHLPGILSYEDDTDEDNTDEDETNPDS